MESEGGSPEIPIETAISMLKAFETAMTGIMTKILPSIQQFGITKYLETENVYPFYNCFGALEALCVGFGCTSPDLLKKLERLSLKVPANSDAADSIESYFQIESKWSKFLEQCDTLLEKEEKKSSNLRTRLLDNEVELLSETDESTTTIKIEGILSTHQWTWLVFLRHYT